MFSLLFLFLSILFILSTYERVVVTYLEDDLLWFLPFIRQIMEVKDIGWIFKNLLTGELTFIDGIYFVVLSLGFGHHLQWFAIVSVVTHFFITLSFYYLLKNGLELPLIVCQWAALMYFAFFGHHHVYLFPLSAHHQLVILLTFLILNLYLRIDKLFENHQNFKKEYGLALILIFLAAFQRMSIFLIPLCILVHIFFTTESKQRLIAKYDLWLPIFIFVPLIQIMILIVGSQGDVLSEFLKPLYQLLGERRGLFSIPLSIFLPISIPFFVRFLLLKTLRDGCPFSQFINKLTFLVVFFPQMLYLCLYAFWASIPLAVGTDELTKWHHIRYPDHPVLNTLGLILVVIMILCFLRFMVKKNPHLIIFVVWYAFLIPYLYSYLKVYPDMMPSKYFVYLSPIFCVMFCLFFFEMIPSQLKRWKTRWNLGVGILTYLILMMNIVSIHIRVHRTLLIDYHWSYDYIKIAHSIVEDLKFKGKQFPLLNQSICVIGIQDVPHKKNWQMWFLHRFDFDRFDSFRLTLLSMLPGSRKDILVNDVCPPGSLVYHVKDFIVFDEKGKMLEPFYQDFRNGLQALLKEDYAVATQTLQRAVREGPFLLQFLKKNIGTSYLSQERRLKVISELVDHLTTKYFDGDEKINQIDTLIGNELRDYGASLACLGFLKEINGDDKKAEEYLRQSLLLIRKEDLQDFALAKNLTLSSIRGMKDFIETGQDLWPLAKGENINFHALESYKGFDLFLYANFYFGLANKEGPLDLVKWKAGQYTHYFTGTKKYEIRQKIDYLLSPLNPQPHHGGIDVGAVNSLEEIKYKDYQIIKFKDRYYIFDDEVPFKNFSSNLKNKALFKARSYLEVKAVIDHFESM